MRRTFLLPLLIGSTLLAADGGPAASAEAPPAPSPTTMASPRAPAEAQREAMMQILAAETSPDRKAWFVIGPGDPETKALASALGATFAQAGWKVETRTVTGMVLKPGIAMLAADEEPPLWVGSVQNALDASGLSVKYGSGYRPYYEEKKKENPSWVGVPIEPDEAFVIVIGPAPAA